MDALNYEHLLRRIYQVGRYGGPGIDADEYRKLERAKRVYELDVINIANRQQRVSTDSIDDLLYDYQVQCRRVWSYVSNAIHQSIKDHAYRFSQEEIVELRDSVEESENITKELIDATIKKAEKILVKHKIFSP